MPVITLITAIDAPVEKVFDLARSIDLHVESMSHTNEKPIGGRLSGLAEEGETVTWEARHFFKTRILTSKIVSVRAPHYFRDVMIEGDFKLLEHDHYFTSTGGGTQMKDVFHYEAPYGLLGRLAGKMFLTGYLRRLLKNRNRVLKAKAEGK